MNKIAVVILNWNGCDMLRSFLPSVVRFSEADGAVVYVADNGSTDASVDMLCREFLTVRLILLEENQGFADGYNMALQEVDAEYVVLLNSDVEVTEHWLQPLVDYMDAHPEAAACQPKIRSWRQKEMFEYAGAAGGFLDRYGYPFCRVVTFFPFIGVIAYAGTIIDERKDGYCYQIIQKRGFHSYYWSHFVASGLLGGLLAVAILISLYLLTDIGIGQNPLWKDAIQVYLTPEFGSENETVYFGIHILTKSAGHVELVLLGMVSFFLTGCLFGLLGAIIAFVSDARVLVYAMPMIIMETGCGGLYAISLLFGRDSIPFPIHSIKIIKKITMHRLNKFPNEIYAPVML